MEGNRVKTWTGETIFLHAKSDNISSTSYKYHWNLGDGTTKNTTVVEHTYDKSGTYNVTLTIYNGSQIVTKAYVIVEVDESTTLTQIFLVLLSTIGWPIAILLILNIGFNTASVYWRKKHPERTFVKWNLKSKIMFNLLIITLPTALILFPLYIIPALVGSAVWIALGMVFVLLMNLAVKIWNKEWFAKYMGERLCVIEREEKYYPPIKGNILKAIKQRSGVALELMPLPLFGVFILVASYFKYVGNINEALSSPWFLILLAMAPIYTGIIGIIRILKDSNLVYINPEEIHVQFVGDVIEKFLQKAGFLGGLYALFQIILLFTPNLESAYAYLVALIPLITTLVMGYVFLTAFIYIGFHPQIVKRLNKVLSKSNLPHYRVEKAKDFVAILPPSGRLEEK